MEEVSNRTSAAIAAAGTLVFCDQSNLCAIWRKVFTGFQIWHIVHFHIIVPLRNSLLLEGWNGPELGFFCLCSVRQSKSQCSQNICTCIHWVAFGICSSQFCGTEHFRQSFLYLRFILLVWGTEIYEVIVQSFSFNAATWRAPAALKSLKTSSQNFLAVVCLWLPLFMKIINSPASWLRGSLLHLFAAHFTMFCWWSFILIVTKLVCFYFNCGLCMLVEIHKRWQKGFFCVRIWGRGGRRAGGKTTVTWTCARECKQYLLWKPPCNVRSPFYYISCFLNKNHRQNCFGFRFCVWSNR